MPAALSNHLPVFVPVGQGRSEVKTLTFLHHLLENLWVVKVVEETKGRIKWRLRSEVWVRI